MKVNHKLVTVAAIFTLAVIVWCATPCSAQTTSTPLSATAFAANASAASSALDSSTPDQAPPAEPPTPTPGAATSSDDQWHLSVTPYLWFPGMHGTVGVNDLDASVHASAIDLLSHFRFGLAGAAELRRKRFLIPLDFMWVRLGDDKSLPFPNVGASSADITINEVLLTPEIGYRLIDHEKLKIDAVSGIRYWYLRQNVDFSPNNLNLTKSQSWVDPLVGGRIEGNLSPKFMMNIMGDVGGWGAGSQLEYQVVGLLGYKINPKWILQAGYRYLDVDYRSSGRIFDVAMPGIMFGVTINLK